MSQGRHQSLPPFIGSCEETAVLLYGGSLSIFFKESVSCSREGGKKSLLMNL